MVHIPNIELIKEDLYNFSYSDKQKIDLQIKEMNLTKKVLLTGSTGFLGQHLLIDLIDHTDFEIYCLVRSKGEYTAKERLNNALIASGHDGYTNNNRIIVIEGDLTLENLGISCDKLDVLEKDIDAIYHCGAYVHHLHNYNTLRKDVLATKFLIDLSVKQKLKKLHFISTINIANYHKDLWKPADNLDELNFYNVGYVQVKWTCEKIINSYIAQGYPYYIYRPGNITGHSKTGYSIPHVNHALLLLKGFLKNSRVPKWKDLVEMTPVDIVSKSIVLLSINIDNTYKNTFNLHNSNVLSWEQYISKVTAFLGSKIEFVDPVFWRTDILPNVEIDNPLIIFKDFYSNPANHFNYQPLQDKVTENIITKLGIKFPSEGDFDVLIQTYLSFLLKIKFLTKDC